jgi:hypothetical protein
MAMTWAVHTAHVEEENKVYKFWWESMKEREHLEDQGMDRMGLEWILGRLAGGSGFNWLNIWTSGGVL